MGTASELAREIAINAIAAFGSRESNRDVLEAITVYDVSMRCTGTVDGEKVSIPIKGFLHKGLTNPSGASTRPDMLKLLAIALDMIPRTKREALCEALKNAKTVKAMAAPDESFQLALALVQKLTVKSPRAGSVRFLAEPPE